MSCPSATPIASSRSSRWPCRRPRTPAKRAWPSSRSVRPFSRDAETMLTQVQAAPGTGLDAFFKATGVAVIGASDDITKIGGRPIQLLLKYRYAGTIYPINPKGGMLQGLRAYASILDTPTAPELAIVAVPAQAALQAVRDCASRGVRGVIVLSSRFAEAGPEGVALQAEMVRVARTHGMRLLGPNCLGAVNVVDRLVGSFSIALEQSLPPAGQVGIVS